MHPPVIELRDVGKRFPSSWNFAERHALRGINLTLEPGTVLGLIGSNGSGKSTLIKCAMGLFRTTSGTATVFGENSWDLSAAVKARIGYVPQESRAIPGCAFAK